MDWMKGKAPLAAIPTFEESAFAVFMNRFCEVGWMLHRLLPAIQPHDKKLPATWAKKWPIVDESFEQMVCSLTARLGKPIGGALVEFVKAKFPFSASSSFRI